MVSVIEQGLRAGKRNTRRLGWVVVAGLAILCIGVALSLALGARSIPFSDVLAALRGQPGIASSIVWERRLPRTLVAVCAGCALALAGAVLQIMTRNPLADTGVFGINVGASLAAAIALGWWGGNHLLRFRSQPSSVRQ